MHFASTQFKLSLFLFALSFPTAKVQLSSMLGIHQSSVAELLQHSHAGLCNFVTDDHLKNLHVSTSQFLKFDAEPRNAGLTESFAVGIDQLLLVGYAHDVDRDPVGIAADADLLEILGLAIGIVDGPQAVADVGVGNRFAGCILAIQEPELCPGHQRQHASVQLLHVAALGLCLRGDVSPDAFLHTHANSFTK